MKFFLHHFFQRETNDRTEGVFARVPKDPSSWPAAWTKIEYKQYSLFAPIPLKRTRSFFFDEILVKRRSCTGSIDTNSITVDTLAYILHCGAGLQGGTAPERLENRTYPSAGRRYPLEVYLFLFNQIDELSPGVYHYAVKEHVLEPLKLAHFSRAVIVSFSEVEWLPETRGMIVITGVFSRVVMKYSSRGYRFALLEAGHMAQNMLLAGTEKKINMIPLGGIHEEVIEGYMGLNTIEERIVYALAF